MICQLCMVEKKGTLMQNIREVFCYLIVGSMENLFLGLILPFTGDNFEPYNQKKIRLAVISIYFLTRQLFNLDLWPICWIAVFIFPVQDFVILIVPFPITVGKRNLFMGYGILLHELPVVAVLFTQSNKDATYSSSCVGIAKFGCREVWNLSREVIPLTHSAMLTPIALAISSHKRKKVEHRLRNMGLFESETTFRRLIKMPVNVHAS